MYVLTVQLLCLGCGAQAQHHLCLNIHDTCIVNDHPDFIFLSPKNNIGQDWPAHPTFWLSLFPPFPHNTLRKNELTLEKSMAGRNLAILHLSLVEDLDMFRHTVEQIAL